VGVGTAGLALVADVLQERLEILGRPASLFAEWLT
jgi:hypothetical protein